MTRGKPDFIRDYAKCLKDIYVKAPRFPQPDWPPTNATEATKLVVISIDQYDQSFSEKDTFEHDYVYGNVDNIKAFKNEIELTDILAPVISKDSKSPRVPKVLMDGAPGVGKTTLTIKSCVDWAQGRLFMEYEMVILVSLR